MWGISSVASRNNPIKYTDPTGRSEEDNEKINNSIQRMVKKMQKYRLIQFQKILYLGLGLFILYISLFISKNNSIFEIFGLIFLLLVVIICCGYSYSFDDKVIIKQWYFCKKIYKFSEISFIVNFKSNLKVINIYFQINEINKDKRFYYLRKYIDYSDGIEIGYWFQKKKMKLMIEQIIKANCECNFAVKENVNSADVFLENL